MHISVSISCNFNLWLLSKKFVVSFTTFLTNNSFKKSPPYNLFLQYTELHILYYVLTNLHNLKSKNEHIYKLYTHFSHIFLFQS